MRPIAMGPPMGPRMPMFPPSGPGVGQQMFYGQAPPLMPPQVTFYLCEYNYEVTIYHSQVHVKNIF
jgi:hypothetical protein